MDTGRHRLSSRRVTRKTGLKFTQLVPTVEVNELDEEDKNIEDPFTARFGHLATKLQETNKLGLIAKHTDTTVPLVHLQKRTTKARRTKAQ